MTIPFGATDTLEIFAPAKINLFLHISGKTSQGYHNLQSLAAFCDIGDLISLSPAPSLEFQITGPYAKEFEASANSIAPDSGNIVIRALHRFAALCHKKPDFRIVLEKNLPLSSGIGGGSSDAAALLRGLCHYWNYDDKASEFHEMLLTLGADMPICYRANTAVMRGIGDILTPFEELPHSPILLVNPRKPCPTQDVFRSYKGAFREELELPQKFQSAEELSGFLSAHTHNDLLEPAKNVVPDIHDILEALKLSECLHAGLSGSGATCYGLYSTVKEAEKAAQLIRDTHPGWWAQNGIIGGNYSRINCN